MNKAQLVEQLSEQFEGNKRQAQAALDNVLDAITRAVAKGEKVVITGFGAFEKVDRPARYARNPRTGERVRVKKTSVPKFKAGADLKAYVSGAKKLPRVAASTARSAAGAATRTARSAAGAAGAAAGTTRKTAAKSTAGTTRKTAAKSTTPSTAKRATAAKKTTGTKRAAKKA